MIGTASIVGGGIAGLAAAASLAQRGWAVHVYERADTIRAAGAGGIYLYENGLRVLAALGALDEVIEGASRAQVREVRDGAGTLLSQHQWAGSGRVFAVTRQRLVEGLAAAARRAGATISTGEAPHGVTEDGALRFGPDRQTSNDLVVAADGVNSVLRDSLGLLAKRQAMRDGAIRVLVPLPPDDALESDDGVTTEAWSGSLRILSTPCSRREIYMALTMLDRDDAAKASPIDKSLWQGAFPFMRSLIDRIGDDGRYDRFEYLTLKRWSAGRVAVIGDAAHAMPPNIGQGGGCAMMNALSLAIHVTAASDIPTALRDWERSERPTTEHAQRMSLFMGRPATWPRPLQRTFFSLVGRSKWLGDLRMRTARHIPTGTDSIPRPVET